MWGGPLHNREFVQKMQKTVEEMDDTVYSTRPRMLGMLSLAAEVHFLNSHIRNLTSHSIEHHKNSPAE
jgi:tRNA G26 N,N-dimethylase Trm1